MPARKPTEEPVIRVATRHMDGSSVPVEAVLFLGGLSLHAMPPEDGQKSRRAYTVTHVASGRFVATGIRKKTEAESFLRSISAHAEKLGLDLNLPLEQLSTMKAYPVWVDSVSTLISTLDRLKSCAV